MVEILPLTGCSTLRFGESYDATMSAFGKPKAVEADEDRGYMTAVYENLQVVLTNGTLFTDRPSSEFRVITIMCSDPNVILFGRKVIGLSFRHFSRWTSRRGMRCASESGISSVTGWKALHFPDMGLTVDFWKDRLRRIIVEISFSNLFGSASPPTKTD